MGFRAASCDWIEVSAASLAATNGHRAPSDEADNGGGKQDRTKATKDVLEDLLGVTFRRGSDGVWTVLLDLAANLAGFESDRSGSAQTLGHLFDAELVPFQISEIYWVSIAYSNAGAVSCELQRVKMNKPYRVQGEGRGIRGERRRCKGVC